MGQPLRFDPEVLQMLPMVADGSNPDFVAQVIDLFLDSTAKLIRQFKDAAAAGHTATMQQAAHTLKSSAATVGAMALAEQARAIEMALRAGAPLSANWSDDLLNGIEGFRQALASHRDALSMNRER